MIQPSEVKTNYSSNVELYLVVGARSFRLSHMGPDKVTLRDGGIELEKGPAEVVMLIDGKERRWDVLLKTAAVPFETTIQIADA